MNGFNKGTIYEEFFHAGQYDNYYAGKSQIYMEVGAKVATVYAAYISADPELSLKEVLDNFGVGNTDNMDKLIINENGTTNKIVASYFDHIKEDKEISKELKEQFQGEFQKFAKIIGEDYGIDDNEVENYDGSTEYWDEINESED